MLRRERDFGNKLRIHCPEALRYAKVCGRDVVSSLILAYAKRLFPDSTEIYVELKKKSVCTYILVPFYLLIPHLLKKQIPLLIFRFREMGNYPQNILNFPQNKGSLIFSIFIRKYSTSGFLYMVKTFFPSVFSHIYICTPTQNSPN